VKVNVSRTLSKNYLSTTLVRLLYGISLDAAQQNKRARGKIKVERITLIDRWKTRITDDGEGTGGKRECRRIEMHSRFPGEPPRQSSAAVH